MTTEDFSFDPKRMLSVLTKHGVDFIVIGGVAATLHASPFATFDLDICPAPGTDNLRRLTAALEELDARIRVTDEPEPMKINFSPKVIEAAPFLNLITKWGPLDIVHRPGGTEGYRDIARDAKKVKIQDLEVAIASRADVLRSKEAVYRDKDIPTIRVLRELEERELEKRSKGSESS